ncbi:hypothetical protein A3C98_01250 [Candidatus Roizmanbacteria bacterium RIFCSPHIGHO2_02_FULL_37_15]|uniref:HTH cro/C1-type domain-containing protein n=1 Tax=Candidatus Roizmanbacteria bacterium RIFCSPLOWO2_01_FULL_37_16 TaxID=1802058 RepID=A0A1F7IJQ9_9BACT|nr:MAG: hypothetical protein A2859_02725 [Candidatus Roizmanbacteria bacterium RIFCSPHIGHO2_01_FULL_37_16b]OGK22104.1 MAG: hypothetical protein A3C98_01250 [Candidatus Roizmanbacteria bacterium RIFCSPHIGHO2_02_FULL_37_15]OGK31530.1 MAG: hypothetical protein A3F57_06475 [Candidatus Roizmanbacteria bacterium RIFCSPHIGHO2_12_FULL_36_11]OGK43599.1 MAG: hypothetical protein A3B40_05175 [Candidatus Roizmanbacteria bacterium RIFCSPLOWO2_01_FULL_37_16]
MLSVGEILKKQREKLSIELNQVEKQIKVRQKFLKAIEENNWNIFTSKVYVEGIINNYSKFLELDSRKTLAFFRRDYEKQEIIKFKSRVVSRYLTPETKKIVLTLLILVFLLFIGYFGYQLKLYFSPPKITILAPKVETFKKADRVKILGKTEKDAAITIFGERIYQNESGIFEFNFPLHKGKNELVIEVIGANGRKAIIKKDYFRRE